MHRSILIAEDSPTQADALRILLEHAGYYVGVSRSGEEALQQLAARQFGLVLTDIMMPGINGYELCRRIKTWESRADTPVVLLTSLTDPTDIVRGLEAGADNYITKPYDPDQLLSRIRRVMEGHRLRPGGRTSLGVDITFLGTRFTITSEREQILDLLLSSVEDIIRTNRALEHQQQQLAEAHERLAVFAREKGREARASTERYRALMQNAGDAIFIVDGSGMVLEANQQAADLFAEPMERLLARRIDSLFAGSEQGPALFERIAGLRRRGEVSKMECQLRRPDGTAAFLEISASLTSIAGEALILAIMRDVTSRKHTEEQLRQAQRMEAIGRLSGGIAHDFNNVLTAIKGGTQLLLLDAPSDSSLREELQEIDLAADRAAALTRQLLAFSRRQVIQPTAVDLNDVVRDLKGMMGRLLGEDVELCTEFDPELPRTLTDRGQMEQVLLNLAVNARDAMPHGGTLEIRTRHVRPDEVAALGRDLAPRSYALLSVRDTGTGMPPEVAEQIFEPFFTTKPLGEGTGLGLSTVYGIVRQTEGDIWVDTTPGHGSTFTVVLPASDGVDRPAATMAAPAVSSGGSETILLVEDEDTVRRLARRLLTSRGYNVVEANNGAEALELVQSMERPIDLLVTDVVMPKMSGHALAEALRRSRPGLRVLYMSGYTDDAIANHGVLVPGIALVEKPFTPDEFAAKVRAALQQVAG